MPLPAQLRVIIEQDDVRKLTLPLGIPDTLEDLLSIIMDQFQLKGDFFLMYHDKDFGNDFFTLRTTSEVQDKDTVKICQKEPVVLNLSTVDGSDLFLPQTPSNQSIHQHSGDQYYADESSSSNSGDTILLSPPAYRSDPWPAQFKIPTFSHHVEMILEEANKAYHANGTLYRDASVKSDIKQALAEVIFQYTAYPTSLQIMAVVEALIEKFPCLKEPGSFSGMYGWQQSLKYKMHNYRAKLRNRKVPCPEIEVNSLKRKSPSKRAPAKNIKRPKKAEVNYLPPHPVGENQESLEKERLDLLCEVKKKNNQKVIAEKMAKTFSSRRLEVVSSSPAVQDFKERWPALFSEAQIKEEFRRITTIRLEETFMENLDRYTPRLLQLLRAKGGVPGTRIRPILDSVKQITNIERSRDAVIQSLMEYLGESKEELFKDCQEDDRENHTQHVLKILVIHAANEEDPVDIAIIIEGCEVLTKCVKSEAPVAQSPNRPLLSEEEMERKSKSIIDEFLHINDYKEAVQCVEELDQAAQLGVFVRVGVESTLERSQITRDHMGHLLSLLLQSGTLSKAQYFKGFSETLELADDMAIDIPHIWLYLAELVAPVLREGGISMAELFCEFSKSLLPVGRAGIFSEVLHLLCKDMSHRKVGSLWRESGLNWEDFLPEREDVSSFISAHKLEFTLSDCSSPEEALSEPLLSPEELNRQLEKLLLEDMAGDEQIFDWVEANLNESQMSSPPFLRALMTSVCKAAVTE